MPRASRSVGQGKEYSDVANSRCPHARGGRGGRVSRGVRPGGERRHRDGSRCVRSGCRGAPGGARPAGGRARCRRHAATRTSRSLGNGGYDARNYDASFAYDPATDRLDGHDGDHARRRCRTLSQLRPRPPAARRRRGTVDHRRATFTRDGQELQITPRKRDPRSTATFLVTVGYGGVPQTIVGSPIVFGSPYGFLHTDDGAFRATSPTRPSTWLPRHDHPQRQGDARRSA